MNESEFRALVQKTLDAQQVYFKGGRKQSDLIKAKELESRVRKELAAGPDVIVTPEQDEGDQLDLFGE